MKKKHAKELKNYRRIRLSASKKEELVMPLSEIFYSGIAIGIILVGGSLMLKNSPSLTFGVFISFIALSMQLLAALRSLVGYFGSIQFIIPCAARYFELMHFHKEAEESEQSGETRLTFKKSIRFENMHFAYDQKAVLHDINLEIKKNSALAIVGASGAGKSTFTYLLQHFYQPTKGDITMDGISWKNINPYALRKIMGVVSQDTLLFNDTFAANISFGKPEASPKEIIHAATLAYAHEFIDPSPKGYDTIIGERGQKLSGGQQQRIAIARMILRNPQIVIFDEATSALDSVSEKLVQKALEAFMKNRTCIIIAHRLSTIRFVDHIVVLHKGRIAEEGTHKHLIDKKGVYHHLVQTQSL